MSVNLSSPHSDDQMPEPAILRLYMVRHGQTNWNSEGRLQGHTDIPLNEEGLRQAESIGRRLSRIELSAVYSSDLQRAAQTARAIADFHGLEVTATPYLRESCLGEWEGLTADEIVARGDEQLWNDYRKDSTAYRPPGGEPYQQVWDRLMVVRDLIVGAHPKGHVAVVGHGGSMRALLSDALGSDIRSIRRMSLDNASLSIIERSHNRVIVRLLNDTSHL